MIELINFFREKCIECSILEYDRILFDFKNILIVVYIEPKKANKEQQLDDFYALELKNVNIDISFLQDFNLSKLIITDYDFLGWREDIKTTDKVKSLTNKLYSTINIINSIEKNSIENYFLDINDGYDDNAGMCGIPPNFIFKIIINKSHHLNISFFKSFLNLIIFQDIIIPQYLLPYYKISEKKLVKDSGQLKILNTNTKARRIGYFKILANFFDLNLKVPSIKMNTKFEDFTLSYLDALLKYKNPKGAIQKTKSGNSSEPYLILSKELELISTINVIKVPGKIMKVFQVLKKDLEFKDKNIFELNELDKYFFLELFIKNDFLYLNTILEILYLDDADSYTKLVDKFPKYIISKLDKILDNSKNGEYSKEIKNLKKVKNRILSWDKPEIYLEHVLMPRLNWMFDLDLLSIDAKLNIKLNEKGTMLFKTICYWSDINYNWIINPESFLQISAINAFHSIYKDINYPVIQTFKDFSNKIFKYLDECFVYFKTLAPNRITSSQAITYIKLKLYFKDNIIVEYSQIENYLENEMKYLYIYKIQKQYGDGYIQKIK